jgi:hypothetical protein
MGNLRGMVIGVVKRRQYTFHDAMANKSDSRHDQRKEETKVRRGVWTTTTHLFSCD